MALLIDQATVLNVFSTPARTITDKKTGEVKNVPAGHKAQLQWVQDKPNGERQVVLQDFNVHGLGEQWKKVVGKVVRVQAGMYIPEGSRWPELYIVQGSLPTVMS
jgi:hypothetical protein